MTCWWCHQIVTVLPEVRESPAHNTPWDLTSAWHVCFAGLLCDDMKDSKLRSPLKNCMLALYWLADKKNSPTEIFFQPIIFLNILEFFHPIINSFNFTSATTWSIKHLTNMRPHDEKRYIKNGWSYQRLTHVLAKQCCVW